MFRFPDKAFNRKEFSFAPRLFVDRRGASKSRAWIAAILSNGDLIGISNFNLASSREKIVIIDFIVGTANYLGIDGLEASVASDDNSVNASLLPPTEKISELVFIVKRLIPIVVYDPAIKSTRVHGIHRISGVRIEVKISSMSDGVSADEAA